MRIGLQAIQRALLLLAACSPAPAPSAPRAPAGAQPEPKPEAASEAEPAGEVEPAPEGNPDHAPPPGPRLTSIRDKTWIWPTPARGERFLGYVRVGGSVALRSTEKVGGLGCARGFFAVEPRGYVCDDRTVTLETETPFLRANAHSLPREGPFPYDWAISSGAPMYARLPTAAEQEKTEWRYGPAGRHVPLPLFQRGHEHLAVADPIAPRHAVPGFLAEGRSARGGKLELLRRSIPHGSMFSYTRSFELGGRTFLLSTDLTVVPADRVRRFARSRFRGTALGTSVKLPLAWFRVEDRPQYELRDGAVVPNGKRWAVRTFVPLTGKERGHEGRTFLEAAGGLYADAGDATVVRRRERRPFGVSEGDKWIIVSITQGTLVAYDDLEPVYTTLISPGQGGLPRPGGDLVKDSTTPLGAYRITFKDRATTMSPEIGVEERSFWIADVPFTQYFSPPFALHGAYWHEKFGEFMSGGCINASPIDAEWLFGWTDPEVPDGWQGATGAGARQNGKSSWIVVTR